MKNWPTERPFDNGKPKLRHLSRPNSSFWTILPREGIMRTSWKPNDPRNRPGAKISSLYGRTPNSEQLIHKQQPLPNII